MECCLKRWHSKILKEDIGHYDRKENSDSDKNMKYLWNCINRAIRIQKEAKNAIEQENYLKNELQAHAAPAPGLGTPKAKKAPKAKKSAKADKETPVAAPAPPGLQRGRSQTRGSKKTDADIAKVCYFHNCEGCNNKDTCQFAHTTLSEADKARQIRPSRSGSPAPGKGPGKGKGRGKGKKGKSSKGRSRTASPAASGRSEPLISVIVTNSSWVLALGLLVSSST